MLLYSGYTGMDDFHFYLSYILEQHLYIYSSVIFCINVVALSIHTPAAHLEAGALELVNKCKVRWRYSKQKSAADLWRWL